MLGKLFKKSTVSTSTLSTIDETTQNDMNEVVLETPSEEAADVSQEFLYPTANEMAQKSSENYHTPSIEEIFEKITYNAKLGKKSASFWESTISPTTLELLQKHGYKVDVSTFVNSPCFSIEW